MKHIAFDLGAESGRAIVGEIIDGKLISEEIYRFPTQGTYVNGSLRWDLYRLFGEMQKALKEYAQKYGDEVCSMGVDTWGVDYGILDRNGKLCSMPYHYRDKRNVGTTKIIEEKISLDKLYEMTGIEYMEINTLNQLLAAKKMNDPVLEIGEKMLFTADMLQYFLSGVPKAEHCLAVTSNLYNTVAEKWSDEIFDMFELPKKLKPEIIYAGDVVGKIREDIAEKTGVSKDCLIITPPVHDTASAAVVTPNTSKNVAFISSGTWSLTSLELDSAIVNEESRKRNIANSGGGFGKVLFLKSLMGLWLIQQSKRRWIKQYPDITYESICNLAEKAQPFYGYVDPDNQVFLNPENMLDAVCDYLKNTGQNVPNKNDIGQMARIIMESLAFKYKYSFNDLCVASGKTIEQINIIGGGSQNQLLNQFTANAMGLRVVAGPVEATSTGSILAQAYGAGEVESLQEIRQIVIDTFDLDEYSPIESDIWEEKYQEFLKVCSLM